MHNETFYTNKKINDIKIAVISDIHFYKNYKQKIFDRIIKQIEINKPDYITIVGDILDSSDIDNIQSLIDFFSQLTKTAPTIIIAGNHDEKKGHMGAWDYQQNLLLTKKIKLLENVHLLNDEIWQDNNITFYGFNLSYNYYEETNEDYNVFCKEINNLHTNLPSTTYNITLCHSPINIYTFIEKNSNHNLNKSDLILSGHMHNGCLPFIISHPLNKIFKTSRGLISPTRKFFPKYAQGRVYKIKDGYIYEGLTKLSNSTKFFHKFDCLFRKNVEFLTIKSKKQ